MTECHERRFPMAKYSKVNTRVIYDVYTRKSGVFYSLANGCVLKPCQPYINFTISSFQAAHNKQFDSF